MCVSKCLGLIQLLASLAHYCPSQWPRNRTFNWEKLFLGGIAEISFIMYLESLFTFQFHLSLQPNGM